MFSYDSRFQQKDIMGIDSEDIKETWFNLEELPKDCTTKFGIFIDHKHKKVVLAIRGTMSYNDICVDKNFKEEEVKDFEGHAHHGIFK